LKSIILIFVSSIFIAYACKKDKIVQDPATVDAPITNPPAWNERFVGTYEGKMAFRGFYGASYDPWILRDSEIVIGQYPNYPDYNTTSLQQIPSIHFYDSTGFPGQASGPLTIFKFEGDSLYYHGKTANGAGVEIEFHGIKTP
jgi:hypothetical protein